MKKKYFIFTAILIMVIIATILVFSSGSRHVPQANNLFRDRSGNEIHFSTNFQGRIRFYDAEGKLVGMHSSTEGDPVHGGVDLIVASEHYHFEGLGKHQIVDKDGRLIGTFELVGATKEELLNEVHPVPVPRSW